MSELYKGQTMREPHQIRQLAFTGSLKSPCNLSNYKSYPPLWQIETVCFQAEYQECFCSGLHGHLLYSVLPQQPPQLLQISIHVGKKTAFLCNLKLLIYLHFSPRYSPTGSASSQHCSLLCRQILQTGKLYTKLLLHCIDASTVCPGTVVEIKLSWS